MYGALLFYLQIASDSFFAARSAAESVRTVPSFRSLPRDPDRLPSHPEVLDLVVPLALVGAVVGTEPDDRKRRELIRRRLQPIEQLERPGVAEAVAGEIEVCELGGAGEQRGEPRWTGHI